MLVFFGKNVFFPSLVAILYGTGALILNYSFLIKNYKWKFLVKSLIFFTLKISPNFSNASNNLQDYLKDKIKASKDRKQILKLAVEKLCQMQDQKGL